MTANVYLQDRSQRRDKYVQERERVDGGWRSFHQDGGRQQLAKSGPVELTERGPTKQFLVASESKIAQGQRWKRQHVGNELADRGWAVVLGRGICVALVDGVVLPALDQMAAHIVDQSCAQLWHVERVIENTLDLASRYGALRTRATDC